MVKLPLRGRFPVSGVSNPLAGFGTSNFRDSLVGRLSPPIEERSFGTNNLRLGLAGSAGGAAGTEQQQGELKPKEGDKK
jgi:hypothetical protein